MDTPRSHVRRRSEASVPSAPSTIRRLHSRRPSSPGVSSISSATTQSIWEQLAATSNGLNRVEPSLSAERSERSGPQWTQLRDAVSRDEAGDSDTEGEQSTVLSQTPRHIAAESVPHARTTLSSLGSLSSRDISTGIPRDIPRTRERALTAAYLDPPSSSRSEAATPSLRTLSRNSEIRYPSNTESETRPLNPFSRSAYVTMPNRRRPDLRTTTAPIPPVITRATPAPPTPQNPRVVMRASAPSPEPRSIRENAERLQQNSESLERSINQLQQRLLMEQLEEGRRDRAPQERVEIRDSSHRRPESRVESRARVRDPRPERTPASMNRPGPQVRVGGGVRLSQHTAEGAVATTVEQRVDEGRSRSGQMQDIASNRLREYLAGYERRDGEQTERELVGVAGLGEFMDTISQAGVGDNRERERRTEGTWADLVRTERERAERAERAERLAERVERAQERPASTRHHMQPAPPPLIVREPSRARERTLRTPGTPWRGRRTSSTSGVAGGLERFYDGPFRSHGMEETVSPSAAPVSAEAERELRSPPLSPRERIPHSTIRHEAERELRSGQLSPRENPPEVPRDPSTLFESWRRTEDVLDRMDRMIASNQLPPNNNPWIPFATSSAAATNNPTTASNPARPTGDFINSTSAIAYMSILSNLMGRREERNDTHDPMESTLEHSRAERLYAAITLLEGGNLSMDPQERRARLEQFQARIGNRTGGPGGVAGPSTSQATQQETRARPEDRDRLSIQRERSSRESTRLSEQAENEAALRSVRIDDDEYFDRIMNVGTPISELNLGDSRGLDTPDALARLRRLRLVRGDSPAPSAGPSVPTPSTTTAATAATMHAVRRRTTLSDERDADVSSFSLAYSNPWLRPPAPPAPPPPPGLDQQKGRPEPLEDEELKVECECKVCFGQLADTVLLPCKHLVLCRWCADALGAKERQLGAPRRGGKVVLCPVCRVEVDNRITVFRS